MHITLNNLLDEFSHCNSASLSTLLLTYCMIVKRGDIMATIWIHFIHLLYTFIHFIHGERQFVEFG